MSNKLIIHTTTRVILRLTKEDSPTLRPFESIVIVDDNYNLTNPPHKLDVDNVTKLVPTQQELGDTYDDLFPQRRPKRLLLALLDDIASDTNLAVKLRLLATALKNFYGTQLPGGLG